MKSLINTILFFAFLSTSLFGAREEECTPYPEFCETAAESDFLFSTFKKNPYFQLFRERLSHETGLSLLSFIKKEYPDLLTCPDKFRGNDLLGSPLRYDYGSIGSFSPTTLYYAKIAADLQKKFGNLRDLNLLEIGGCYGGQCKVIHDLYGFKSYTIVDTAYHLKLAKRYLKELHIPNVHFLEWGQSDPTLHYDLLISNGALSSQDSAEFLNTFQRHIIDIDNGYLIMNLQTYSRSTPSLPKLIKWLLDANLKCKIENEIPALIPTNRLITWQSRPLAFVKAPSFFNQNPKEKISLNLDAEDSLHQLLNETSPPIINPLTQEYSPYEKENAICYALSGGRLGDNLSAYFHARWLCYKLGIPLRLIPFEYYDQLALSDMDILINTRPFRREIFPANANEMHPGSESTLYVIPYFSESPFEFNEETKQPFTVDWEDPLFDKEVRRCLHPKHPLPTIPLPSDRLTIGLHVRRGGGFDGDWFHSALPLKFPPDSYYIEQLEWVLELFKDENPYIFLLTDDQHPEQIVENYRKALNRPSLEINYRKENNSAQDNVLSDFFTIANFDCFIGSQSHFSLMASKLGDYLIAIYPTHPVLKNNQWVVDRTKIFVNGKSGRKLASKLASPHFIPPTLRNAFTLFGKIEVQYWYFDQRQKSADTIKADEVSKYLEEIKAKKSFFYGETDLLLYQALNKYRDKIKDKEIAIFGPSEPIYEAFALAFDGHPTRISLIKSLSEDERVKTMSQIEADTSLEKFDAIFSIVSVNHEGLGRYGDPIDPNGDLMAMMKAKKMLKRGGLLFLSVPIGKDCLVWNAHRIYGWQRMPLLLRGWEIVESFGFKESDLDQANLPFPHQPILVLRPSHE